MTRPGGRWRSQPYPAEGATASVAVTNQLGRPTLDRLTVLVREAAQNSWDARATETGGSSFDVSIRKLTKSQRQHIVERLLPEPARSHLGLRAGVVDNGTVLVISDRGTSGLGGPTRADVVYEGHSDFVAFARNTGEPPDKAHGGGTFGFGKGIFFTVSGVGTVLVRTRCEWDGRAEERFIGMAVGPVFDDGTTNFTGRHWWGDTGDTALVEPLLNAASADIARSLGLQDFADGEFGTDIVIIAPVLGEGVDGPRDHHEAGTFVASSMLWNLWPKLIPPDAGADAVTPMTLGVTVDGKPINVPRPDELPTLRGFAAALRRIRAGDGDLLRCNSPLTRLGLLALERDIAPRAESRPDILTLAAPFSGNAHHVARMRQAELVVDYYEGPRLAGDIVEYAGVFKASLEADNAFRDAEPPTHDAWVHADLPRPERTFVRTAETRLRESLARYVSPAATPTGGTEIPLGAASAALSALVVGASGHAATNATGTSSGGSSLVSAGRGGASVIGDAGAGSSGGGSGGGSGGPKPRGDGRGTRLAVRPLGQPSFGSRGGRPAVMLDVEIVGPVHSPVVVEARAAVALSAEGQMEKETPAGAATPDVLGWVCPADDAWVKGSMLRLTSAALREWRLVVRPVPGTATAFEFDVQVVDNDEP